MPNFDGLPGSQSASDRGARLRLVGLGLIALAVALFLLLGGYRFFSADWLGRHRASLMAFVQDHRSAAILAYTAIYASAVALSLPGAAFLTICGGFLFGAIFGGVSAVLAATAGGTLLFLLARGAARPWLVRRAGSRLSAALEEFRSSAVSYLLFLRLVPIFPFWAVNLAAALSEIRLAPFVFCTALGIVPGTIALAAVGAGLENVFEAQEAAHQACIQSGAEACKLEFRIGAALTPPMLAALATLGVLSLLPVLFRWRRSAMRPAAQ